MSVRRLAEAAVQPSSFAFSDEREKEAQGWIAKYPKGREQSAIIPLLMLAQEQEGWVTKAAIETIADRLGMAYIRALEVATFYTQFQLKPVGTRAHVQVCGTTPCMLRGAEALMDVCRDKIHHDQFHRNAGGTLSWEEVECLGACVNAPMVMIFKDTYEDLTPERLAEIIDAFEAGRGDSVKPGPQVGRIYAAPQPGLTSLKDETAVLKSTRDREAAEKAKADAAAGGEADVAPSNAAKPKTDAIETSPAIKSPSPKKVPAATEKAASASAPAHDPVAANKAEPAVEGGARQRRSKSAAKERDTGKESPELLRGEPVGPAGKRSREKASKTTGEGPSSPARLSSGTRAEPAAPRPSLDDADRPRGMERPAQPDDLQLIAGVGPKNERLLHELGIYTFAQVAAWKKAERQWVDGYLKFHGRIEREDWVKQAKALAKGGEAEYIRVFGKKPR